MEGGGSGTLPHPAGGGGTLLVAGLVGSASGGVVMVTLSIHGPISFTFSLDSPIVN